MKLIFVKPVNAVAQYISNCIEDHVKPSEHAIECLTDAEHQLKRTEPMAILHIGNQSDKGEAVVLTSAVSFETSVTLSKHLQTAIHEIRVSSIDLFASVGMTELANLLTVDAGYAILKLPLVSGVAADAEIRHMQSTAADTNVQQDTPVKESVKEPIAQTEYFERKFIGGLPILQAPMSNLFELVSSGCNHNECVNIGYYCRSRGRLLKTIVNVASISDPYWFLGAFKAISGKIPHLVAGAVGTEIFNQKLKLLSSHKCFNIALDFYLVNTENSDFYDLVSYGLILTTSAEIKSKQLFVKGGANFVRKFNSKIDNLLLSDMQKTDFKNLALDLVTYTKDGFYYIFTIGDSQKYGTTITLDQISITKPVSKARV